MWKDGKKTMLGQLNLYYTGRNDEDSSSTNDGSNDRDLTES